MLPSEGGRPAKDAFSDTVHRLQQNAGGDAGNTAPPLFLSADTDRFFYSTLGREANPFASSSSDGI